MGFVSLLEDIEKNGEGASACPLPTTIVHGKPYQSEEARLTRLKNVKSKPKSNPTKAVKRPSAKSLLGRDGVREYIIYLERKLDRSANKVDADLQRELNELKAALKNSEATINRLVEDAKKLREEILKLKAAPRSTLTIERH